MLHLDADLLDATRYESIAILAEKVADTDPEHASQLLDEAEELWGALPCADVEGEFADAERRTAQCASQLAPCVPSGSSALDVVIR